MAVYCRMLLTMLYGPTEMKRCHRIDCVPYKTAAASPPFSPPPPPSQILVLYCLLYREVPCHHSSIPASRWGTARSRRCYPHFIFLVIGNPVVAMAAAAAMAATGLPRTGVAYYNNCQGNPGARPAVARAICL